MEDETTGPSAKQKNAESLVRWNNDNDDEEFNPTLAAETEIKPKVLKTVSILTKEYNKLIKYQKEKLNCILKSESLISKREKL